MAENKRFTLKIQGNKAEEIYIGIVDNLDNTIIPLIEKGDYFPSGINYVVEKLNHLNDSKKKYPNFEVIEFNIKDEDKINELKNDLITKKDCGTCKHFQLDGMFGMWCDINDTDYLKNTNDNCPNYEK